MIRTRFTEMLGLEYPILSAPMAMHSGATLAAAVSGAGGLGSFGGSNWSAGPEWIAEQAALIRKETDRPFAVGFITPFLPMFDGHFRAALEARPGAIVLSFAAPDPWAGPIKDAGCVLICQVQSVATADAAVAAGADVLVVQGTEAGGHTGEMALLPLLAAVAARHPTLPLVAAGGLADGRTLAAALTAGADGACLGTAFLATAEAIEIADDYKAAIVASDGGDTVFTRTYDIASGASWPAEIGARVQRTPFVDEWTGREAELPSHRRDLTPAPPFYFGQSAAFVSGVGSAGEVVREICESAERVLRDRPGQILGDEPPHGRRPDGSEAVHRRPPRRDLRRARRPERPRRHRQLRHAPELERRAGPRRR